MSQLFDPTRIFPVVEYPFIPGPRFGGANDNGVSNAEALVVEPIRDRRLADHHPRAAARTLISKLLRNALSNAIGTYHGTRTSRADVTGLRDPTDAEAGAVTTRLAADPVMAEAFRRIRDLRGAILWLDNLDKRDGIPPRAGPAGQSFPGVAQGGPTLPRTMTFLPVGIR